MTDPSDPVALSPREALDRLVEGNKRFLSRGVVPDVRTFHADLAEQPQRPVAIVLGCSDSRTPVEILFDQGFGDLFVVRIAGNIVAPSIVGSIEFAASQFGTSLVVVLGHTKCGAVAAAVTTIQTGGGPESRNIRAITDRIIPHIETMVRMAGPGDSKALQRAAMRANVRASADHLRHGSRLLEDLVLTHRLAIVGAEFELETGRVEFVEALSPDGA